MSSTYSVILIRSVKKYWPNTGRKVRFIQMSDPLLPTPTSSDIFTDNLKSSQQSSDSKHSVNLSQALNHPFYSPAASRASRLVKLALDVERPMTAISGRKCLRLFDLQNPNGSSLKTCVASLL